MPDFPRDLTLITGDRRVKSSKAPIKLEKHLNVVKAVVRERIISTDIG
jgi:hypothetical protein